MGPKLVGGPLLICWLFERNVLSPLAFLAFSGCFGFYALSCAFYLSGLHGLSCLLAMCRLYVPLGLDLSGYSGLLGVSGLSGLLGLSGRAGLSGWSRLSGRSGLSAWFVLFVWSVWYG